MTEGLLLAASLVLIAGCEVMRTRHAHIARVAADGDALAPAQGGWTLDDVLARLVGVSPR